MEGRAACRSSEHFTSERVFLGRCPAVGGRRPADLLSQGTVHTCINTSVTTLGNEVGADLLREHKSEG